MRRTIVKITKNCQICAAEKNYKENKAATKIVTPLFELYDDISIDLKANKNLKF